MRSIILSLLIGTASATASAVSITATATTIGHQFSPSARSTVDTILGSHWGAATAPSFTASLSAESTFSMTVSAPEGFEFLVRSAPNSTGLVLSFGSPLSMWIAPGWNGGQRDFMPTTVSFTGYDGPNWYNDTTGITVDHDGRGVVTEGSLWWSGSPDIRFKSVTISADLTSLSGKNFPLVSFAPDLAAGVKFQNILPTGTRIDPGPAVALVSSVPEPSALVLVAAGGLLLLFRSSPSRRKSMK